MPTARDDLLLLAESPALVIEWRGIDPADLEMVRCPLCSRWHDGAGWRVVTPKGIQGGICLDCWERCFAQETAHRTTVKWQEFKALERPVEYSLASIGTKTNHERKRYFSDL